MVQINYASWLSTRLQSTTDNFILPENISTISDLLNLLTSKGEKYKDIFKNSHIIRASLNGSLVTHEAIITDADQVTFFSPIAGG